MLGRSTWETQSATMANVSADKKNIVLTCVVFSESSESIYKVY